MTNTKATPIYYRGIGLHLSLLLDVAAPDWKKTVDRHQRWLIGMAEDVAKRAN